MSMMDKLRDIHGSGGTCTKCCRPKPRMDSSPCYQCVLENIAEAEKAVAQARSDRKWPPPIVARSLSDITIDGDMI